MKLCLHVSSKKIFKKCFHIFAIKTCRSSDTRNFSCPQTQGLATFHQSPCHILSAHFARYPTVRHNHAIFFTLQKRHFDSLLLCVIIMQFCSLPEILNKFKFLHGTKPFLNIISGCVLKYSTVCLFLKFQQFCMVFEIPKLPAAVLTYELLLLTSFMTCPTAPRSVFCSVLPDLLRGMLLEAK